MWVTYPGTLSPILFRWWDTTIVLIWSSMAIVVSRRTSSNGLPNTLHDTKSLPTYNEAENDPKVTVYGWTVTFVVHCVTAESHNEWSVKNFEVPFFCAWRRAFGDIIFGCERPTGVRLHKFGKKTVLRGVRRQIRKLLPSRYGWRLYIAYALNLRVGAHINAPSRLESSHHPNVRSYLQSLLWLYHLKATQLRFGSRDDYGNCLPN